VQRAKANARPLPPLHPIHPTGPAHPFASQRPGQNRPSFRDHPSSPTDAPVRSGDWPLPYRPADERLASGLRGAPCATSPTALIAPADLMFRREVRWTRGRPMACAGCGRLWPPAVSSSLCSDQTSGPDSEGPRPRQQPYGVLPCVLEADRYPRSRQTKHASADSAGRNLRLPPTAIAPLGRRPVGNSNVSAVVLLSPAGPLVPMGRRWLAPVLPFGSGPIPAVALVACTAGGVEFL
jgi:hypothetical protein